jgi:hypothetical protein
MIIKIIKIDPAINKMAGRTHEVKAYWCTYMLDEICAHAYFIPYHNTDMLNRSFAVETSFSKIKNFRIDTHISPQEIKESDREGNYQVADAFINRILQNENGENILIDVSVRGFVFSLADDDIGSIILECREGSSVSFFIEELFLWDQGL